MAKADRLDSILDDGQIRRFEDSECWFCESLPKMKAYMEQTVMCEGKPYPDVMSIEQMCEILSISTKTGYRILREGKICCLKVGRAYRIPKAHLFTFLCIGCGEAVTA